ncbi:hypothetical protein ABZX75_27285 [Streptomyces sp. NPDC003038]|uniref:hypothetical protein n=1 Tax=unclassified Streptomyces TaxID=2593676 RepID=UPI0033B79A91
MTADAVRTQHGWSKSGFDELYDQPDPRTYFAGLRPLDYRIPHHAQPHFRSAVARLGGDGAEPVTVLDVCSSYGINAALLKYDVTLEELYARYTGPATGGLSTRELIDADKEFYASRRREDAGPLTVVGLDVSRRAVGYGCAVGLLDAAYAENLERNPASGELAAALAPVRLITVTGGIGYIGPRTFETLLTHAGPGVWVAAFALRSIDYGPFAAVLERHGLCTRTSGHTFPQRRFTDAAEQQRAVEHVRAMGLDPAGRESEGHYHAVLHASRPAGQW